MRKRIPAGPMEYGERPFGLMDSYRWAKRSVNWRKRHGKVEPIQFNISRAELDDEVSVGIFLGDEMVPPGEDAPPGAQMSEEELREMLVAIGCVWAMRQKEGDGNG